MCYQEFARQTDVVNLKSQIEKNWLKNGKKEMFEDLDLISWLPQEAVIETELMQSLMREGHSTLQFMSQQRPEGVSQLA